MNVDHPNGVAAPRSAASPPAPTCEVMTAFEALLGRQPTAEQRERLLRVRDALGLRDDDAIWLIVMAFDHYDALFRQYPAKVAEAAAETLERTRAAYATAAAREAALAHRSLSETVARTSVELAERFGHRRAGVEGYGFALAAVVAFGALCLRFGYDLGTRTPPFWVGEHAGRTDLQRTLGEPAHGACGLDDVCVSSARRGARDDVWLDENAQPD